MPTGAWLGLLYAAILSVTVTNILYFTAIHRIGASRAALFTYMEPFLGVLFAVILLGDAVTLLQLAGGAVDPGQRGHRAGPRRWAGHRRTGHLTRRDAPRGACRHRRGPLPGRAVRLHYPDAPRRPLA